MKKKEADVKEKLRIRIKAYDAKLIENSSRQIIDAIKRHGGEVIGPIPLPTEIRKYTVNRSTFVHKTSREQFEMRIHKRLIDIMNPQQKIVESLKDLNLPAGVDIEIRMG
ncbi:30S ribosomal protein S10 [Candidatus Jorgensenbacteria bacterium RIFCSPLOWO2_01_FULL_45_25b]|uniref:Small ribosomal subunit protein uS10 n=1 Tax=Candidatus Jorgensenbacteria bacterium RIFCSPLOWO2_01_FULL_45_25b TaxID=1798471 RepID=A0A1F6BV60_9BACT|nr:MAG: 30S ribosomal protein S10 [Candidatus Jorgensenbacteria bacterium RIFCSPLOWO2_01_FULL_45_25b]